MITDLRKFSQSWGAKFILFLVVVPFVISFGYGTFTASKEVVAKVGTFEILVPQFSQTYQEQLDSLRQRFPDNAEIVAQQLNLRERVLDQIVNRRLLLNEAEDLGLRVSENELREAISSMPGFQVNNAFDFGVYQAVLKQNNQAPETFEARLREDLLLQRVQRTLTAGVVVSPSEIDQRYRIAAEAVEADYVYVDPAKFKPTPAGAEAIQAYYDKHPADFAQPAQYRARYFILSLKQMEEGAEIPPRAVERYYERNLEAEFTTPRRVRASELLKRMPANAPEAEVAAKRKEMETALKAAQAGGDFTALVKKHSDGGGGAKAGDLGFFGKEEMPAAVADAAFALKTGQVSGIISSPFGLHILKVTAVQAEVRKPLAAVRAQIEKKLKAERAERRLELELERLPGRIQKDGLEASAKEFKAVIAETSWFDGTQTLPALGASAELYGRVKGRRANDVGVLKRNPVQGHVFFQVREAKEAFTRPLADVRAQVETRVAEEQRREAALAEAKTAFPALKAPEDLAAYAKKRGFALKTGSVAASSTNIPGVGPNREFQQAAFRLTKQQPFALSILGNQVHLLHLKRRYFPKPGEEKQKKSEIAGQLEQEWRQFYLGAALQRLREKYPVKVLIPELLSTPAPAASPRQG
jgi:peptidyl-prolyl cis-trans isomerase D